MFVPTDFTLLDPIPKDAYNNPDDTQICHETLQFYPVENVNYFPQTTYYGLGYIRRVRQANITPEKGLIFDNEGNMVFKANASEPDVHQETGYFLVYKDNLDTTKDIVF